jgi:hypothetical protein
MSTITNIALERFDLLPKAIQDAIAHSGWSDKVRFICKKNQLNFDLGTVVENSTLMVMVGVLSADELIDEIKEGGVSDETAKIIIRELEEQIFLPIKKELVETFNNFEGDEISVSREDTSLDILTGESSSIESAGDQENDREKFLKEIEELDSAASKSEQNPPTPNEIIKKEPEMDKNLEQKTAEDKTNEVKSEETQPETSSIEKKLTGTVSTQPQIVKIDPYREILE